MLQRVAPHVPPEGAGRVGPGSRLDPQGRAAAAFGLAAIVMLLTLIAAAMYFADGAEKEKRRVSMINDALWVEQALRFAIRSTEDELSRLASDIRTGQPTVSSTVQVEQIMRLHPELARVALRRADGTALFSLPGADDRDPAMILRQSPLDAAMRTGERLYGDAYYPATGALRFDLAIPSSTPGGEALVLVASFTFAELLNAHIPWWVAQKNHVEIRDAANMPVASKSLIDTGLGTDSHVMPFDPPGHGLTVQVTPYDTGAGTALRALIGLIVLFSGLAAASLFVMQRNVRRRQKAEEALRAESAFRKSMEEFAHRRHARARSFGPHHLCQPGVLRHGRLVARGTRQGFAAHALLEQRRDREDEGNPRRGPRRTCAGGGL